MDNYQLVTIGSKPVGYINTDTKVYIPAVKAEPQGQPVGSSKPVSKRH